MNYRKIAVFDADACITMGNILDDGTSHLSKLLQQFDECFIHETVFNEVKTPTVKPHLTSLVSQDNLKLVTDKNLLKYLVDELHLESVACQYYIDLLKENIKKMPGNNQSILNNIYTDILSKNYTCINHLLQDLNTIESGLPRSTSIGEIKTSILITIFYFLDYAKINLFLSNDRNARTLIVSLNNSKVQACSSIGSFLILKQVEALDKNTAEKYLLKLGENSRVKVMVGANNYETKTFREIFNDIFQPNSPISMTIDGYIKYNV